MSQKVIIYPGTFDPLTYGHIDIIERGANLAEKLIEIELWDIQATALHPSRRLDEILFAVACLNLTHLTFCGVIEIIRIGVVLAITSVDAPFHVFTCHGGFP